MRVSHTTLKALAAVVWITGAVVLLLKGSGYLLGASGAGPAWSVGIAAVLGLAVGLLRGRTMFLGACRRNLRRIDALERPRFWQFYRPGFFAALVVMMAAGSFFSWLAGLATWTAVVVGGLELVIGTALLTSSPEFLSASEAGSAGGKAPRPTRREAGPAEEPAG